MMGQGEEKGIAVTCVLNYKGVIVVIEPNGELTKYRARGLRYYERSEIEWLVQNGLLDAAILSNIKDVPKNYVVVDEQTGRRIKATADRDTQRTLKEYRLTKYTKTMW